MTRAGIVGVSAGARSYRPSSANRYRLISAYSRRPVSDMTAPSRAACTSESATSSVDSVLEFIFTFASVVVSFWDQHDNTGRVDFDYILV